MLFLKAPILFRRFPRLQTKKKKKKNSMQYHLFSHSLCKQLDQIIIFNSLKKQNVFTVVQNKECKLKSHLSNMCQLFFVFFLNIFI